MPDIKVTDDDILALYAKGTPISHIPANNERIRRVLTAAGVNATKLTMRHYAKQSGTAPPNEWAEKLKATAKQQIPQTPPIYHGSSRLRDKLNQRRWQEATA